MNRQHLELCSSAEWAETLQKWILPWVLDGVDLGNDVLEIGPGPGLTTDILRTTVTNVTAVEIDPALAEALATRLAGTNVNVVCADASRIPLPDASFSGAVCLTMLHHISSEQLQDLVLAEVHRLLRSGGALVGEDSLPSAELEAFHQDDIYVPIDPLGLSARLEQTGFTSVDVVTNDYAVRFRATKP